MAEAINGILNRLPVAYRTELLKRLEPTVLPVQMNVYQPGVVPKYAHFMTSGVTSVVTFMQDGNGVEVGLIGREGLVEGLHLLGAGLSPTTAFIQADGTALRMPFLELKAEFETYAPLRTVILAEVQAQSMVLSQIAACNRLHELEERLARWLLMASDRLRRDSFTLTQEFLAEMIGARRTTVTLVAGSLQRSGLIEYKRGHIQILDREGLEDAACECYPVVRDLIAQLVS